jgi:hypothetical protein
MDISASGSSSIGVQQILPRTGTSWQPQNPTPVQSDSSAGEEAAAPPPDRGATAEGVGQVVDKLV